MKLKRIVFVSLGWLFLLFQIFGYLGTLASPEPVFKKATVPFMIGYNLPLILAIVFFVLANKQKRRIAALIKYRELDSFLVEEEQTSQTQNN